MNRRSHNILEIVRTTPGLSSSEIHDRTGTEATLITTKRSLTELVKEKLLIRKGRGKAVRYYTSQYYQLFYPISEYDYFEKEVDERVIIDKFNLDLIPEVLMSTRILSDSSLEYLNKFHRKYVKNISSIPESVYKLELERLGIDLSWKSSQIEGNTYSLLETELLLKESIEAVGKKKDEATMLLNHKRALDFIIEKPDDFKRITVRKIEEVHAILAEGLGIDPNIRTRIVGITGTNYRPLDNEYQIRDSLEQMCELINREENVFEKALLALLLISYIQPFTDGNKRTARIISNAILISYDYCPLSFRTVDPIKYKQALLLFYEQNNTTLFRALFMEQYKFAVETYFQ